MAKMTPEEKTEARKKHGISGAKEKCDNCGKPLSFVTYKGSKGVYCCNECRETEDPEKKKSRTKDDGESPRKDDEVAKAKSTKKTKKSEKPEKKVKKTTKSADSGEKKEKKRSEKVAGRYKSEGENAKLYQMLSSKAMTLEQIAKALDVSERRAESLIAKLKKHGADSDWKGKTVVTFRIARIEGGKFKIKEGEAPAEKKAAPKKKK